jgi:plasmid stabilization system protein ParE
VTLSQRARAEINHAIANAGTDAAAVRLLTRFEAARRRLGLFPELGRVGRRAETRELLIAGTSYQFI